jgi:type II secretory pathway pseudopilin PulG
MAVWVIVLIVLFGLLALLFLGGFAANARARAAEEDEHAQRIAEADQALAAARAEDRGWNRTVLEDAARAAFAAQGVEVNALELIQVVDRPGTEEDRALFRGRTVDGFAEVELARSGDTWQAG